MKTLNEERIHYFKYISFFTFDMYQLRCNVKLVVYHLVIFHIRHKIVWVPALQGHIIMELEPRSQVDLQVYQHILASICSN